MDKRLLILKAFQLTLPRAAAGWLFALLTSNFNRIAIYDLGITAVVITSLLGLYHFLSPFQVIYGRIADRIPIFGLHRTPYVMIGMTVSAIAVATLPYIVVPMSQTPNEFLGVTFPYITYIAAFIVLVIFGIGFAGAGANHLALVAEVIPERSRGVTSAPPSTRKTLAAAPSTLSPDSFGTSTSRAPASRASLRAKSEIW